MLVLFVERLEYVGLVGSHVLIGDNCRMKLAGLEIVLDGAKRTYPSSSVRSPRSCAGVPRLY